MIRSVVFKVNPTTRLLISGFIVIIFLSVLIAGISLKENSEIAELNEKPTLTLLPCIAT